MLKQYFFIKPLLPIIVYLLFILGKSVILLNNKNGKTYKFIGLTILHLQDNWVIHILLNSLIKNIKIYIKLIFFWNLVK